MVQYMKKEEGYLETFLSNRLPKVAAPFAVGLVIYYAANRILNSDFSLGTALQSFVTGKIYVSFSWYVIAIILFYLVFYAAARISKDQYKHLAFMIAVGLLVYSLLCHGLGFQKHCYKTCTNFLLGVVWGIYSEPISKWLDKKWLPTICFSLLGFVFFYVQVVQNKAQSMGYFLLIHYLSSAFFCITVAALGKKVQLNSRLLTYLGDISYEVYLSQGLAILFFRNDLWYQRSDYLFSVGVFLGSVLIAVLFHKINMFLLEPKKRHRYAVSFVELLKDKLKITRHQKV
jgi:peptidoglycan/LPS O-acetylase OafA/YrhL